MKKQIKKSLSLFLAVLMLMTSWVWVAPEKAEGWEISELREEDCNFFVKGAVFGEFEERKLRIPSLSHA